MKYKLCTGYLNQFITFILLTFLILLPSTSFALETNYHLTKIVQLEHDLIVKPNWQQIVANPSNKQQQFVIKASGQVYLIDTDGIHPIPALDMRALQQSNSSTFQLTAIELHPNFSLRNQIGYGTFYTAHIEDVNNDSKTKRLYDKGDDLLLNFDAVVTEWQFNAVNYNKVDVSTHREVLRIGIPDASMVIKQISFNPYIKPWNEDFGLLYIGLTGTEERSQPLYSGVVLRIDPAKFGLRSFTVPDSNPYVKNNQINDAIYLMGGQEIEQFIWPSKNSDYFLISHKYNNKYLLSLTGVKNDWRDSVSKHVLYQSDETIYDILMYKGRQLPQLRSKLLLLRQKEKNWFVESIELNYTDANTIDDEQKSRAEWLVTSPQLPDESILRLKSNHSGEVLFLEKTVNILFRLTQQEVVSDIVAVEKDGNTTNDTNSSNNHLVIFILIFLSLGIILYFLKRNNHSIKARIRQQFSSFELSESCQQISLYHRHQRSADTIVDMVDIMSSEIQLNELTINIINRQHGHGFTNEKEQDLRTIFVNEKIDKMVDGKIRHVSLILTDNNNTSHTVCLYMRKGSDRLTKKSYVQVVEELIDWCWLIGAIINKDNTDKRKSKPKTVSKEKSNNKVYKKEKTSLHNQDASDRPVVDKVSNIKPSIATKTSPSTFSITNNHSNLAELANDKVDEIQRQVQQNSAIDTEVVNALEKLVSLKEQGYLTMEEFTKAKETLLKSIL